MHAGLLGNVMSAQNFQDGQAPWKRARERSSMQLSGLGVPRVKGQQIFIGGWQNSIEMPVCRFKRFMSGTESLQVKHQL